jgi:hypothetical protein
MLQQRVHITEVTFEGLPYANGRGSHHVVDEPDRFGTGFRGKRYCQLQADLGLRRQKLAAPLDIVIGIFGSTGCRASWVSN